MYLPKNPSDFDRYSGFIFDLDGTLIDSMPYHIAAWKQTAKERGFSIDGSFIVERGGFSSRNIVLDMQKSGFDTGDVDSFVNRKVALYRENLHEVRIFEPVLAVLRHAAERGAGIAIGTGTQRINAVDILRLRGIEDLVDVIVSSDDVTCHKPDPETYFKAAELMGVSPADCVVFEDGAPGIRAAVAARMDCVIVGEGRVLDFQENSKLDRS